MYFKILNSLREIDLFGLPVELNLKRATKHKTLFGAIMSLFIFGLTGWYCIEQIMTMILHLNPNTLSSDFYNPDPQNWILNPSNFTLTFGLQDGETYQTFINESLAHTQMKMVHKYQTIDSKGNIEIHFDDHLIPIIPCSKELIFQKEMKEYLKNYDLPTQYCTDFTKIENLQLQGTFDADDFWTIEIDISECKNNTNNQTQPSCMPIELIHKKLNKVIFAFQLTDTILDLNSPFSPHITVGKDYFTTLNNRIYKNLDVYIQTIETNTDYGYFTEDIQSISGLKVLQLIERMDFSQVTEGTPFFKFVLRLDNREIHNQRSYIKLLDILSNAGGLWELLFVILLIFVGPINELSQKEMLLNSLFKFEQIEPLKSELKSLSSKQIPTIKVGDQIIIENEKPEKNLKQFNKTISYFPGDLKRSGIQDQIQMSNHNVSVNNLEPIQPKQVYSLKSYFKMSQKKLILSFQDYLYQIMSCLKPPNPYLMKKKQITFSSQRLIKSMDIVYIIKKLNELDKFKSLMLSSSQLKVFDYLQKPTIDLNPYNSQQKSQVYWSILKKEKSDLQNALEAKKAYDQLKLNSSDPINTRIFSMLDSQALELFQMKIEGEGIQDLVELKSDNRLDQEQNVESDCEYQDQQEEHYNKLSQQTDGNKNIVLMSPRSNNIDMILRKQENEMQQ